MDHNDIDKNAMLKQFAEQIKGSFWEMLGCKIESVDAEKAVVSLMVERQHYNSMGMVHGGVTTSLLDSTMGLMAMYAHPGKKAVTTNLNVHFVTPFKDGKLTATAVILHASRSTVTLQGTVTGEDGKVGVFATSSFRILD